MSKYKILFKISGSIAAYKSAYIISRLVQEGMEVQTVVSDSALKFIGKATLEGLTGRSVLFDHFQDGQMMIHIDLMRWADLIVLCPATANTINKFANGIGDSLLSSLFLAHNWDKPYLIAPAMNTAMYNHPTTRESINKLKKWGVEILPTDSGYLACGEIGEGKLLEPDEIFHHIIQRLPSKSGEKSTTGSILITSGATREYIDGVRFLSNISTGNTGSVIATHLASKGWEIIFLHGENSKLPKAKTRTIQFRDHKNLNQILSELLSNENISSVIHLAAVSDYSINSLEQSGQKINASESMKIDSDAPEMILRLSKTNKIINGIKAQLKNKEAKLIAFKFSGNYNSDNDKVIKLFKNSEADYVVLNHLEDKRISDTQSNFYIYDNQGLIEKVENSYHLALAIEKLIQKKG